MKLNLICRNPNKASILLNWRRKIKERANQLKGLVDNSTETQVSFDDFLMAVVIPDDSSKHGTFNIEYIKSGLIINHKFSH